MAPTPFGLSMFEIAQAIRAPDMMKMTDDRKTKAMLAREAEELRQQLALLKFSEEKLRSIFESITDAITVTDLDGIIIEVNEEMSRRHGSRDKVIGMNAFDMMAPRSLKKARQVNNRLDKRGEVVRDVELVLLREDGSEFTVEVTTSPLKNDSGQRIGSITVTRDISRRKQVESELRALSRRLVQIRDDERRDIARELHDQTGQSLTALNIALDIISACEPEEVDPILDGAKAILHELMSQVDDLSLNLWPSMLDELGLLSALIWHFDQYARQTNVYVDFEHANLSIDMSQAVKTAAYRIVQEALTNVARYAGVDKAKVRAWIETGGRRKTLHLLIEDRGIGFNPAMLIAGKSNGFRGMRERVASLGGSLTIESTPGSGTSILAELPVTVRRRRKQEEV